MLLRLHAAIAAVCPITGVSDGTPGDSATVRVDYDPGATTEQRAAAQAVVDGFDWSTEAQLAWERSRAVAQAISETMGGFAPANISDRVTLRYVLTLLNDVREHLGLTRIQEPDHLAGITAAIAAGAGEPIEQ